MIDTSPLHEVMFELLSKWKGLFVDYLQQFLHDAVADTTRFIDDTLVRGTVVGVP